MNTRSGPPDRTPPLTWFTAALVLAAFSLASIGLACGASLQLHLQSEVAHSIAAIVQSLPVAALLASPSPSDDRADLSLAIRHGNLAAVRAIVEDFEAMQHGSRRRGARGSPPGPVSLGVKPFCRLCRKCATICPSHALSDGEPAMTHGVPLWPTHAERCYGCWRRVGTDCGVCMAVCPGITPYLIRTAFTIVIGGVSVSPWAGDR